MTDSIFVALTFTGLAVLAIVAFCVAWYIDRGDE